MSFEQKKRNELEMDELKIKSHLNTSLEIEGISVSEDLINRTLNAIRLQEAEGSYDNKDKSERNKSIFVYRHSRTLVTVAAAVLLLVVGVSAIRMYTPLGMKKDMAKSENFITHDDAGTSERYSITQFTEEDNETVNDIYSTEEAKSDDKRSGTIDKNDAAPINEEDQSVDMFMGSEFGEDFDDKKVETNGTISTEYALSFVDVTSIEHSDVSLITITSKSSGEMKTLTEKDKIDGFFSIMQNHVFMKGTGDVTATKYIVKITSEDAESQMVIDDTVVVVVDNTHLDATSHSIYVTSDFGTLLSDLKGLMED